MTIRDAYPTKALAHTRVIALSGVDNINIQLWRVSLSKQVLNTAPIDLYIMHDPVKGRRLSTELILSHIYLCEYTYPRILYISDGTLYREGFLELLRYMNNSKSRGWFKNLETLVVIKNYIASYDYIQEVLNPGYAAGLSQQITDYITEMCTDKINFPNLKSMNFNMNGYNLVGSSGFAEELKRSCNSSSGVSISASESTIKYPVFCLDDNDFQSQTMTRTYYYDMTNIVDAVQCRYNWNWEVNGIFNNDITGPYPLDNTPDCPVILPPTPTPTPTPSPAPTPTPEPWFPIYDPFILGDNCNYATSDDCKQQIISETNVTSLYLTIRDAYPTKALAHTRVIALSGVDNINIQLWRVSLSKQVLNTAPIDLYIMHDPVKGRRLSTELILSHIYLCEYTYPRILYISDGTLYREGFLELLRYMNNSKSRGWFKNLETLVVIKNYIASYDYIQEVLNPGYAAGLSQQITDYITEMCTDKINFPNLKSMNFNMNGYNLVGSSGFAEELKRSCNSSSGVSISASESTIKYPVFCLDDNDFQSQTMTRTYYYDMTNIVDAVQCRYNWNWEVNGIFNNDITGPYPLDNTPDCPDT